MKINKLKIKVYETSKKAILGMLVAMVMSLGVMNGINAKSNDSSLQQVTIGCGYMAGATEGGASGAWTAAAALAGGATANLATGGTLLGWNPVGWGLLGACAVGAL